MAGDKLGLPPPCIQSLFLVSSIGRIQQSFFSCFEVFFSFDTTGFFPFSVDDTYRERFLPFTPRVKIFISNRPSLFQVSAPSPRSEQRMAFFSELNFFFPPFFRKSKPFAPFFSYDVIQLIRFPSTFRRRCFFFCVRKVSRYFPQWFRTI